MGDGNDHIYISLSTFLSICHEIFLSQYLRRADNVNSKLMHCWINIPMKVHGLPGLRCILLMIFKSWLKIALLRRGYFHYLFLDLLVSQQKYLWAFVWQKYNYNPELYTFILKEKYPELCYLQITCCIVLYIRSSSITQLWQITPYFSRETQIWVHYPNRIATETVIILHFENDDIWLHSKK
jgi:hypothetical protein